jgi:ABC-type sugar transport system ATPase subunit
VNPLVLGFCEVSSAMTQFVEQPRVLDGNDGLSSEVLDQHEPLSNLDAALGRRLRKEILRLHAELAFTLVYVTHSVSEAREIGLRTIELSVTGTQQSGEIRDP